MPADDAPVSVVVSSIFTPTDSLKRDIIGTMRQFWAQFYRSGEPSPAYLVDALTLGTPRGVVEYGPALVEFLASNERSDTIVVRPLDGADGHSEHWYYGIAYDGGTVCNLLGARPMERRDVVTFGNGGARRWTIRA